MASTCEHVTPAFIHLDVLKDAFRDVPESGNVPCRGLFLALSTLFRSEISTKASLQGDDPHPRLSPMWLVSLCQVRLILSFLKERG